MIKPWYGAAYYTAGTRYEEIAHRALDSAREHSIPFRIYSTPDLGSWMDNVMLQVWFIKYLSEHSNGPVVYLDADTIFNEYPAVFDSITADVAVRWKLPDILGNTACLMTPLYLRNNGQCERSMAKWLEYARYSFEYSKVLPCIDMVLPERTLGVTLALEEKHNLLTMQRLGVEHVRMPMRDGEGPSAMTQSLESKNYGDTESDRIARFMSMPNPFDPTRVVEFQEVARV